MRYKTDKRIDNSFETTSINTLISFQDFEQSQFFLNW